jgi:hypothetical protein
MMDELLKELAPVVESETQRASEQYGDRYASAHEAESVLREEVHELAQDAIFCSHDMEQITANLHFKKYLNGDTESDTTIYNLKDWALNAAAEAVQVAAVCDKIARGFEK